MSINTRLPPPPHTHTPAHSCASSRAFSASRNCPSSSSRCRSSSASRCRSASSARSRSGCCRGVLGGVTGSVLVAGTGESEGPLITDPPSPCKHLRMCPTQTACGSELPGVGGVVNSMSTGGWARKRYLLRQAELPPLLVVAPLQVPPSSSSSFCPLQRLWEPSWPRAASGRKNLHYSNAICTFGLNCKAIASK